MSELREQVRDRYAAAARSVKDGMAADDWSEIAGCCDPKDGLGVQLYDGTERAGLPEEAVLASLGCGNPTAVAELRERRDGPGSGLGRRHRRAAVRRSASVRPGTCSGST